MTALPQRSSPAPSLSTIDDYLFADFTINLSLETDGEGYAYSLQCSEKSAYMTANLSCDLRCYNVRG